jgi:HEAT repeat protein
MNQSLHPQLLEVLSRLCEVSPEIRFGQRMAFLELLVRDRAEKSLWDVEDEELFQVMKEHLADMSSRQRAAAEQPAALPR